MYMYINYKEYAITQDNLCIIQCICILNGEWKPQKRLKQPKLVFVAWREHKERHSIQYSDLLPS